MRTPHDPHRRTVVEALTAGLVGAVVEKASERGISEAGPLFTHDNEALKTTFDCWAPLRRGRLLVRALPVLEAGVVRIRCLEALGYANGPLPCKAHLEVRLAQILNEFREANVEVVIDWSRIAWGRYARLKALIS